MKVIKDDMNLTSVLICVSGFPETDRTGRVEGSGETELRSEVGTDLKSREG